MVHKNKNKIALSFINLTKCLIYEVRIHIIYTLHVRGVQKLELEQPQLRHLSNKDWVLFLRLIYSLVSYL